MRAFPNGDKTDQDGCGCGCPDALTAEGDPEQRCRLHAAF